MENTLKTWRKYAFINIQETINCMVNISNMVVIWSKTAISGYDFDLNKVVWKIRIDDFPHSSQNLRIVPYNGLAIVYISPKPNTKLFFAIDPSTGKIVWVYNDGPFRDYQLIQGIADSPLIPVYNKRNDTFVEEHYILFINPENGQKVQETKVSFMLNRGYLAHNALFLAGYSNQFQKIDIDSPDKSVSDLGKFQVESIFNKNDNTYFLMKDENKNAFINVLNLTTNQATLTDWPEKNSIPMCRWKILDSHPNDDSKLLITWAPSSDCGDKGENTRFGLFDVLSKKFIWKESFTCRHYFITTPYGFFTGPHFRNYDDGSIINQNLRLDFVQPKLTNCLNNAIFYYNWERIEIYVWADKDFEAKRADASGTKIYNFKDLVKY